MSPRILNTVAKAGSEKQGAQLNGYLIELYAKETKCTCSIRGLYKLFHIPVIINISTFIYNFLTLGPCSDSQDCF